MCLGVRAHVLMNAQSFTSLSITDAVILLEHLSYVSQTCPDEGLCVNVCVCEERIKVFIHHSPDSGD